MSAFNFNCLCVGDTLAPFSAFTIAPTRPEASEGGERPALAPFESMALWTIGGLVEGEWLPVHDADPDDLAPALAAIARARSAVFQVVSPFYQTPLLTLPELLDRLTTKIHDDIPGYDDPEDFRADDFDSHELAALREQVLAAVEGL